MKLRFLLRYAGVCFSSLMSILVSHSAHAKVPDMKGMAKTSKKVRSAQSQPAGEEGVSSSPVNELKNPQDTGQDRYPWKKEIVTTTFWIGEKAAQNNPVPNRKSSWDPRWAENYGGTDSPSQADRTKEFIPAKFVPRQNPFYIALPYNDKMKGGHKPEAERVIPWFKQAYQGAEASVCKGRWIAIRRGNRTCYAQWEDAGPFRTDHWEYVFGNARPLPNLNRGAGLDVSPAVRDFLGMNDTDVTDWKFVDFEEVPAGPWARYGDNNTFVINRRTAEEQVAGLDSRKKETTTE